MRPEISWEEVEDHTPSIHVQGEDPSDAIGQDNQDDQDAKKLLQDMLNQEENSLDIFGHAYLNDVRVIRISDERKEPIELTIDITEGRYIGAILVIAGPHAKATVLLRTTTAKSVIFASQMVGVAAETGSDVKIMCLQQCSDATMINQRHHAFCKKDACVDWNDLQIGGAYAKSDIMSYLQGTGAHSDITSLFLGTGERQCNIYTAALHQDQHTDSNIVTKGVLAGHAKGLSRGLISIAENANGSNGYEQQDALMLSETAEADAIPNLEIHNHDVACSHGSTVGQIDEELLFYLMSRGISEKVAKQKIIEGYFMPVIEMFKDERTRDHVYKTIMGAVEAQL
jgi:Fe-S cluster assembly protein SufD